MMVEGQVVLFRFPQSDQGAYFGTSRPSVTVQRGHLLWRSAATCFGRGRVVRRRLALDNEIGEAKRGRGEPRGARFPSERSDDVLF